MLRLSTFSNYIIYPTRHCRLMVGMYGNDLASNYGCYLKRPILKRCIDYRFNILAVWEVLIYDTGAINYKNFLRLIIDKQEFDHNVMRDAINRDNLLLQEVSIATRELTTEQNDFTVQSRLQFGTAMRKDAFDKGQKMLCYAIDGIDSSKQSKSNKAVEIILTILTAMSVYSVVNDGFTLMTNKEEEFTFHFLSSFLFALATAVMLVILFIVIRKRD